MTVIHAFQFLLSPLMKLLLLWVDRHLFRANGLFILHEVTCARSTILLLILRTYSQAYIYFDKSYFFCVFIHRMIKHVSLFKCFFFTFGLNKTSKGLDILPQHRTAHHWAKTAATDRFDKSTSTPVLCWLTFAKLCPLAHNNWRAVLPCGSILRPWDCCLVAMTEPDLFSHLCVCNKTDEVQWKNKNYSEMA